MKCLLVSWIVFIPMAFAKASASEIYPKSTSFIRSGSMSGGAARSAEVGPLSLLKVKMTKTSQNLERFIFTFGDKKGLTLGAPGFFQVALDEGGTRLVIDLSQVQKTAVDLNDLRNAFSTSPLIKNIEMVMDPIDKSTNITLLFKRPILARALASPQGNGEMAIDLQEVR